LSDLHWSLHAWPLLRGQARLDLQSADPRASGRGSITLHPNGDAEIDSLAAVLPLQNGLAIVPAGWRGQLDLDIAHAELQRQQLVAIVGTLTARELHLERPATDLGGFELRFPPAAAGATSVGSLRDIGGPLAVQGSVQLVHGSYQLDATVALRDPTNSALEQLLQLLGPADAQGRHQLSLAGSF
jgi:hypothetical protein